MNLDEFRKAFEEDDNIWWRMGSGDHLNLLEEALELIDSLNESLRRERQGNRCAGCGETDVMALCGWCYEN